MEEQDEQEEQEGGGDKASTRGRLPPSARATTHPAAAEAGGEQEEVERVVRVQEGVRAQLTLAIHPPQEEGLVPLQVDIRLLQEEELAPSLPTLATHRPPTLLEMATRHLLGLPGATTPLPPVLLGLDTLLPLTIPMQLQEITKSMMTTVTRQTQVTAPPQRTSTGRLVLGGQPTMGMQLQKGTPVTRTTLLVVTLTVALSMRAGEARV